MKCPRCGHPESSVIDSRMTREGSEVRRRRFCSGCEFRFTTYERSEANLPSVIKRDGRREAYDKTKIVRGLKQATGKRKISEGQIEEVVNDITRAMLESGKKEVSGEQIGEWVMEALAVLDPVAYIRFASVYLDFERAEDFKRELKKLEKRPQKVSKPAQK